MPLGLGARIIISPESVFHSRWAHDIANALCRARLRLERERVLNRTWDSGSH
jgi:hypothetical protein